MRALLSGVHIALAAIALLACSPAPAHVDARVVDPPRPSALGAPSLTAPPTRFPRETEGVDAALAYLGGFCSPLARLASDDGSQSAACDCCPNYGETCKPSAPGAIIPESRDSVLSVDQVFRGSFRRPGADEVVIIVSGCASAASNGGGTWVGRVAGDRLEDLEYRDGDHPSACKPMPTQSGLDRLLCTFSHGRAVDSTHVLVTSFATADQSISSRELIEVVSNLRQVCERGPGPIVDNRIESTKVVDSDGDGLADVEIVVSARSGIASARALKACVDGEYKGDLDALVPARRNMLLRYLGEPSLKLHPDSATAKLVPTL